MVRTLASGLVRLGAGWPSDHEIGKLFRDYS
jgi:hypothetical protein